MVDPRDKHHRVELNDAASEDGEVKPKDPTTTVPTREGIKHKPDTQMDLYQRRQRRSKQHL
ncbi:hypothetical protein GX563_07335 [Candidatus Bathyarchaeota archaeon]|nr:hypothetical protein [Candidatus Bathyarchaeota archaeon]